MEPAGAWRSLPGLPRCVNRIRFAMPHPDTDPDTDPPRLREPGLHGAQGTLAAEKHRPALPAQLGSWTELMCPWSAPGRPLQLCNHEDTGDPLGAERLARAPVRRRGGSGGSSGGTHWTLLLLVALTGRPWPLRPRAPGPTSRKPLGREVALEAQPGTRSTHTGRRNEDPP